MTQPEHIRYTILPGITALVGKPKKRRWCGEVRCRGKVVLEIDARLRSEVMRVIREWVLSTYAGSDGASLSGEVG